MGTTTISVVGGRLNILVMYFLRIILVFFFVWLPGMIMYYKAYETDRTSAGLLQNIGFFFFTLQAIVSGSMAMSKPDVRKAVYNLYNDIIQILFGGIMQCIKNRRQEQKEKEQQQQQEQQGQSSTTSPQSSSKSTVAKSSTGNTAVDIESGNDSDSNKSNDVNNEDYNNSNDLKEDVALARMIEETECDENDDVEAQSSSTEITFVEHTDLSNAITNTTEISNNSTNTTITSPTIMNTILTNGESYENKIRRISTTVLLYKMMQCY